jgi:ribose transport system substrate-binding protein
MLRVRSVQAAAKKTAVVMAGIVLVAACGNSQSASNSQGSSSSDDRSVVADAKKAVDALSAPIASIGITEKLTTLPKGKSVVAVSLPVPTVLETIAGFSKAAEVLGMKPVQVITGQYDPSAYLKGITSAIALHPDMIFIIGFDPQTFKSVLDPYVAAGGKVIGYSFTSTADLSKVAYGIQRFSQSAAVEGMQATWIVADSNGKANAVHFTESGAVGPEAAKSFTAEMQKCGACKSDVQIANPADVGTALPSKVVSYLRAHPDVNYLSIAFGGMLPGVTAALKAAGITKVKIVSGYGDSSTWQAIANGEVTADLTTPSTVQGWQMADAAARVFAGQTVPDIGEPYTKFGQPFRFLTKANVDFLPKPFVEPPDYEAQFKALWGIS